MDSAAITDHGVMYGVIDFYRAAKAAGHQALSWAARCMWHRIPVLTEKLARMRIGIIIWCCWRRTIRATSNLMKIVSKGFVEGFYYKPRVDMEVLETLP